MRVGDEDVRAPAGAAPGEEDYQGASFLARACLAAFILIVFVVVVLPMLIWAAGIVLAGSR
jgi:hypothetical protein